MRLRSIQEYLSLIQDCEFCHKPLETYLQSDQQISQRPTYNMDFNGVIFTSPALNTMHDILDDFENKSRIEYDSDEIGDKIYFYYSINKERHEILSIDKHTAKISGDLTRIQKVFWDHRPHLVRRCGNENCNNSDNGYGYVSKTGPLVIERKSKTVYAPLLEFEAISLRINSKILYLISTHGQKKQTLLMSGHDVVTTQLPHLKLHEIRGSENIVNKIKTIMVFS